MEMSCLGWQCVRVGKMVIETLEKVNILFIKILSIH